MGSRIVGAHRRWGDDSLSVVVGTPPDLHQGGGVMIVADLGNTRLKWATWDGEDLRDHSSVALNLDAWPDEIPETLVSDRWVVSSVNPPGSARLATRLRGEVRFLTSAAEVAVFSHLEHPEKTGTDRALAVRGSLRLHGGRGPGLVVSCGTAICVERIGPDGAWHGGAIAPGLGLMARALNQGTAQLPSVLPETPPDPFGRSTAPAIAAGVFWGAVGTIRELLERQKAGLSDDPWLVWTGGDAPRLAEQIDWPGGRQRVVPELVLLGLVDWLGSEFAGRYSRDASS